MSLDALSSLLSIIQTIQLPQDGGPVYAETDMSGWIAEPWNAISSLALVIPAIYWAIRLRKNWRKYAFIYYSVPLLIAGGSGSMLYHASRESTWLLYLDVLPTAILTVSVGVYFWWKLLKKWLYVLSIVVPVTLFRIYLLVYHTSEASVNLSYFLAGVAIFLPVILYLHRHNYHYLRSFVISVSCLSISLVLREADHWFAQWIPIGSHFLWHILSGIGAWYLAQYLFLLQKEELDEPID